MSICASEARIGDVIKREYDPHQRQKPWSGLVVGVERAERPDGTELRKLRVRGQRWVDDHFMELTAPLIRERRGFEEHQPEHIPFTLNIQKCTLCRALISDFEEEAHIAWHVSILNLISDAATAHYDLSGGR